MQPCFQLHRKKHLSTGRRGWLSEETRIDNVERLKLPKKHLSRRRRDWLGKVTRAERLAKRREQDRERRATAQETQDSHCDGLARQNETELFEQYTVRH